VLLVSDQGIGIPAADLRHGFDRFFRATHVQGQAVGSGLGLAGVLRRARQPVTLRPLLRGRWTTSCSSTGVGRVARAS